MCCPSVYVGYEIRQSRARKPFNFGLDFDPPLGITYGLNTDVSEPGGLWLGVSNYCQIADRVGVMASGWYLFPTDGDAEEIYGFPNVAAGNRVWTTNRSWGWLERMAVLGSPCGMNLIAGFRWDSYSVRFSNPTSANPPDRPRGTPLDEADLTMNSYIPLIGTQFCCGGPCCGLLVRVLGFPWVPGNLRYGETGFLGITRDCEQKAITTGPIFSKCSPNIPGTSPALDVSVFSLGGTTLMSGATSTNNYMSVSARLGHHWL